MTNLNLSIEKTIRSVNYKIRLHEILIHSKRLLEERLERLSEGLTELTEGLMCIRQQNNSAVGIALAAVLLNERASKRLERILRKPETYTLWT